MSLHVGTARVDITPPLGIPYLGYMPRQSPFLGVHDQLYARAVVVGDGSNRIAFVVADAIGIADDLLGDGRRSTTEVRERAARKCGIRPDHLMVCTTHAHSTPETTGITSPSEYPRMVDWLEVWLDQLADAVALAAERPRPARLRIGSGRVAGLSRNRRAHLRPAGSRIHLEERVDVALFEGTTADWRAILASFACHPVTVQVQPLVSADFPGAMIAVLEREIGGDTFALFMQGAAGDINPIADDSREWDDVARYGGMLGEAVLGVVKRLEGDDSTQVEGRVRAASEILHLPSRALPEASVIEREASEAEEGLARSSSDESGRREQELHLMRVREKLKRVRMGSCPVLAEIQVLSVGDTAFVGIPGELFNEVGLEIRRRSAARHTFLTTCTNGYAGYVAPPEEHLLGGYEVGLGPWAQVGPEAAGIVADTAVRLISRTLNG